MGTGTIIVIGLLLFWLVYRVFIYLPGPPKKKAAARRSFRLIRVPSTRESLAGMRDLPVLSRYLSDLSAQGLPLVDGLQAFCEDRKGRMDTYGWVLERMREGHSLSEAMAEDRWHFPPRIAAVAEAGEKAGALPELLVGFSNLLNYLLDRLNLSVSVAFYPLAIAVASLGIISVILIRIVPQFESMMSDMDISDAIVLFQRLRLFCQAVIAFYFLVASFVILHIYCRMWLSRNDRFTRSLLARFRHFFAGSIETHLSVTTFCQTLATLLRKEVPTAQAVRLAARAGQVGRIDRAMPNIAEAVEDGQQIAAAMVEQLKLSALDRWSVTAAEGSSLLPRALEDVAWRRLARAGRVYGLLVRILEPLQVFLLGSVVVAIAWTIWHGLVSIQFYIVS